MRYQIYYLNGSAETIEADTWSFGTDFILFGRDRGEKLLLAARTDEVKRVTLLSEKAS